MLRLHLTPRNGMGFLRHAHPRSHRQEGLRVPKADAPSMCAPNTGAGGADPVELEFFLRGRGYLHTVKDKNKVEQNASNADAKPEVREWSRFWWHAESDGSIPCPKANDECDNGLLELRSILGKKFITELVHKAEELLQAYKLQDAVETLDTKHDTHLDVKAILIGVRDRAMSKPCSYNQSSARPTCRHHIRQMWKARGHT
ncbi:hypothetical protein VNO77_19609 [Canavalia gladiata]|uniref:Uncharacterized protein n=1 Tax=Canavalia gladiata TaxID=3824 RepID=A0AAN9QKL7_CANGL